MLSGRTRYLIVFLVAFFWIVLDQATKFMVNESIPYGYAINIIPNCFDLVHVLNRGAAFGFLNNADTKWQFGLFIIAAIIVICLIFQMLRTSKNSLILFLGFGSIVGGAIGNLIDRVTTQGVIDFLDFYIQSWHWPAFNIADIAICLGVICVGTILFLESLTENKEKGE